MTELRLAPAGLQLLMILLSSIMVIYYNNANIQARAGKRVLENRPGFEYVI